MLDQLQVISLLSFTTISTAGFEIHNVRDRTRPSRFANNITNCNSTSPLNMSTDYCRDICDPDAICSVETGACVCLKEPTPTMLGGHFIHCTNWNYVEQNECKTMCRNEQRSDSRVCWTITVGHFCTCFGNSTELMNSSRNGFQNNYHTV